MHVLVTGATGLVGRALVPCLRARGYRVSRLVRRTPIDANDIPWDPANGTIPVAQLEGLDAVVHLAGESIAGRRWTPAVKERIRSSRVEGTRALSTALAALNRRPAVFVSASAIGYYGDRGDQELTEGSQRGTGFLADVCADWEAACHPARDAAIRVVQLRTSMVLSQDGGALTKMLWPFQLGLGGNVGTGRQFWSWIALDDEIGAIHHALTHEEVSGPVNATSPQPVTNKEFTRALAAVLHRPALFPLPAFAARLMLGEMANQLLLASARVVPTQLLATGYQFAFPTLPEALRQALQRA